MFDMHQIYKTYRRDILPYAHVGIRIADASLHLWLERMFTCFGNVAGKRVLDFGAGSGHKAMLMAKLGAEVVAIDASDEAVAQMKAAREATGLEFEIGKGDVDILAGFDNASFDCILCSEVFEHIPVDQAIPFRDMLTSALKPGGKLFLTTPNFDVYGPAEDSPEYYQRQPFGHHKHYSLAELRQIFDGPPLRVINNWYECHPLTLKRNHIFYPLAQYDGALYLSKRWPLLRAALKPASWVFHGGMALTYPLAYRLQRAYEFKRASTPTGLTIMLDIERLPDD